MDRIRPLLTAVRAAIASRRFAVSDLAVLAGLALLWSGLDAAIGPAPARAIIGAMLLAPAVLPVVVALRRPAK